MTVYERYRAWNKALYDYYFNNSDQQVLLYVDDDVLAEIGERSQQIKDDLGDKSYGEHFLSSTCVKKDERKFFPKTNKDRDDCPSFDRLMERMARIPNTNTDEEENKCQCLPFAIMLLYLFQKGDANGRRTERHVCNQIKSLLGEKTKNLNFGVIEKLWASIEKNGGETFVSSQLEEGARQKNVGRLKFHLVLKKKDKDAFLNILKENHLVWDEQQETFSDFINFRVWPYLPSPLIDSIKEPIHDLFKRPYFETIVRGCNYSENSDTATEDGPVHKVVYVYSRKEIEGRVSERLWLKTDEPNGRYISIRNGKYYFVNEDFTDDINESVPLDGQTITIDGIQFRKENPCYVLFKEIEGIYEQVHAPDPGKSYLFISNEQSKLSLVSNQNKIDISSRIHVFGVDCKACYIRNWVYDKAWDEQIQANNFGDIKQKYPRWVGGLLAQTDLKKKSYIYPALPFVEFETKDDAKKACLQWRIANSDNSDWSTVSRSKTVGNRKYLNDDVVISGPKQSFLHIELQVVDNGTEIPLPDMYVSKKTEIGYSDRYHYNKYGVCVDSEESVWEHNIDNNVRHRVYFNEQPTRSFILLDILTQYSDSNGILTQERFKRALQYILNYHCINADTDNRIKLIRALVDLEIINGFQNPEEGFIYYNQINKPYFAKTQKSFEIDGSNVYVLRGCFDSDTFNKLKQKVTQDNVKLGYIPTSKETPFYCLPDIVVADFSGLDGFGNLKEYCGIPVVHSPHAYSIIANMADFKDRCSYFLNNAEGSVMAPNQCPVVTIEEGSCHCLNYISNGMVVKAYKYCIDYIRRDIPLGFMSSYVQNKKGRPVVILEPNTREHNVAHCTFSAIGFTPIMGKNELLERALCELNLGLPKEEKAFVVNAEQLGVSDKPIYTQYRSYALSANQDVALSIVNKLCNHTIQNINNDPGILISNPSDSYEIYYVKIKKELDDEERVYVQYNGGLEAFCIKKLNDRNNVEHTICVNCNVAWKRFLTGSINEIFSDVIMGVPNLTQKYETKVYDGTIPTFEDKNGRVTIDGEEVEKLKIIKKQQ